MTIQQLSDTASDYNQEVLREELESVGVFEFLSTAGDAIFAHLSDSATQDDMDDVLSIANNHDNSPTDEQLSKQAEIAISAQITRSKKSLHLVAPIWQVRATHLTGESDATALVAYAQVLATIAVYWVDKTDEQVQFVERILSRLCTQHFDISYSTPPNPITTDYANKFLKAVYQLVDLINAQYKF